MFFHLKSLLYAIAFFVLFQITFANNNLIWVAGTLLIILCIFAAKKNGGRHIFSLIPIIFSLSSIIIFYLIDFQLDRQVFIFVSAIIYYFIFLAIYRIRNCENDQTARGILSGVLLATFFMFYSSFYGIYLNFSIPLWVLMFSFLAITFILSYHYLSIISKNKKRILSYSLILGMAMAEISWVINFWPFGYLTTGVIALIFYYMFWDLAQSYFINKLSKKKIVVNLLFFSLLIGLILYTSQWQLAV